MRDKECKLRRGEARRGESEVSGKCLASVIEGPRGSAGKKINQANKHLASNYK